MQRSGVSRLLKDGIGLGSKRYHSLSLRFGIRLSNLSKGLDYNPPTAFCRKYKGDIKSRHLQALTVKAGRNLFDEMYTSTSALISSFCLKEALCVVLYVSNVIHTIK